MKICSINMSLPHIYWFKFFLFWANPVSTKGWKMKRSLQVRFANTKLSTGWKCKPDKDSPLLVVSIFSSYPANHKIRCRDEIILLITEEGWKIPFPEKELNEMADWHQWQFSVHAAHCKGKPQSKLTFQFFYLQEWVALKLFFIWPT